MFLFIIINNKIIKTFLMYNQFCHDFYYTRQSSWKLCSTCITLCGLILMTTCVLGVAGLIWVHMELKRDVDDLRSQMHKGILLGCVASVSSCYIIVYLFFLC